MHARCSRPRVGASCSRSRGRSPSGARSNDRLIPLSVQLHGKLRLDETACGALLTLSACCRSHTSDLPRSCASRSVAGRGQRVPGSAHVPRVRLRRPLLLYFAAPGTHCPRPSILAAGQKSARHRWCLSGRLGCPAERSKGGDAGCAADCGGGHERSGAPQAHATATVPDAHDRARSDV